MADSTQFDGLWKNQVGRWPTLNISTSYPLGSGVNSISEPRDFFVVVSNS